MINKENNMEDLKIFLFLITKECGSNIQIEGKAIVGKDISVVLKNCFTNLVLHSEIKLGVQNKHDIKLIGNLDYNEFIKDNDQIWNIQRSNDTNKSVKKDEKNNINDNIELNFSQEIKNKNLSENIYLLEFLKDKYNDCKISTVIKKINEEYATKKF